MSDPVLEFHQVGAREGKGRRARWPLRGLDTALAAGEVLGVAGSGKSLFLELASAWRAPDEGKVFVAGYNSLRLPSAMAAGVIWLGEGQPGWPRLEAAEALALQAGLHGGTTNKSELKAALEHVGLSDRACTRFHHLTAREKIHLHLALMWVCSPRLALLDASALTVDDTLTAVISLQIDVLRRSGTAFVLAAAEPHWADLCDRLLWLPEGRSIDTTQLKSLHAATVVMNRTDRVLRLARGVNARIVGGEPGAVRLVSENAPAWPADIQVSTQTPSFGDALVWQALAKPSSKIPDRARPADSTEPLLRLSAPGLRSLDGNTSDQEALTCGAGEIVALLGEGNGDVLAALAEGRRLEGIEARVLGQQRADFGLRRRIAYLPPLPPAQHDYPAQVWLDWRAGVFGLSARGARAAISSWSERLGVQTALKRPWTELSFAEKRLLQNLAAWLHKPSLLLLDRPFAGLDPAHAETLRNALLELAIEETGIVYAASHRGETWFGDRVYVFEPKAVVERGAREAHA